MSTAERRVLVVTLPLEFFGGVQSQARFLINHLQRHRFEVGVATYAARGLRPDLNSLWLRSLVGGRGRTEISVGANGGFDTKVGCRFPGLEFTYTEASEAWQRTMDSYQHIVAVGGTPVIANPVVKAGKSCIVWCADDLAGDRDDRIDSTSLPRRVLERYLVRPKLEAQQIAVLGAGNPVRGISGATVDRLHNYVPHSHADIERMHIPIDSSFYAPLSEKPRNKTMGFAGRIADPRKNPKLLFEVFRELRQRDVIRELHIAGPTDESTMAIAQSCGVADGVVFHGHMSREGLRTMYQSLDVFVLTSHREGLALVGLEAMACGIPVVATRCGGPEDYIEDGVTGYLSDPLPGSFADHISGMLRDQKTYTQMSAACRKLASEDFCESVFERRFDEAWKAAWGGSYRD